MSDLADVRAFFGAKAGTWDSKYPDDTPAYQAAVSALDLAQGQCALDAGCGTGRALPALRGAVGPRGAVIGADLTPQMLGEAARAGRDRIALLVEADAARLPVRSASVDGIFAAGLVNHLPDPAAGLRELGRVARPGARLVVFHPVGRAVLAARHSRTLAADDIRNEPNLRAALAAAGWRLTGYTDTEERFLALAVRTRTPAGGS